MQQSRATNFQNWFTARLLLPTDFLADYPGNSGFTVLRIIVATSLFAVSLAMMRLTSSELLAGLVVPIWAGSLGTIFDGRRGFLRGVIYSVVFPMYAGIVVGICGLVYWVFVNLHQEIWQFAR